MERTDACAGSLHFLQINLLKLSENKKNFSFENKFFNFAIDFKVLGYYPPARVGNAKLQKSP